MQTVLLSDGRGESQEETACFSQLWGQAIANAASVSTTDTLGKIDLSFLRGHSQWCSEDPVAQGS